MTCISGISPALNALLGLSLCSVTLAEGDLAVEARDPIHAGVVDDVLVLVGNRFSRH